MPRFRIPDKVDKDGKPITFDVPYAWPDGDRRRRLREIAEQEGNELAALANQYDDVRQTHALRDDAADAAVAALETRIADAHRSGDVLIIEPLTKDLEEAQINARRKAGERRRRAFEANLELSGRARAMQSAVEAIQDRAVLRVVQAACVTTHLEDGRRTLIESEVSEQFWQKQGWEEMTDAEDRFQKACASGRRADLTNPKHAPADDAAAVRPDDGGAPADQAGANAAAA